MRGGGRLEEWESLRGEDKQEAELAWELRAAGPAAEGGGASGGQVGAHARSGGGMSGGRLSVADQAGGVGWMGWEATVETLRETLLPMPRR